MDYGVELDLIDEVRLDEWMQLVFKDDEDFNYLVRTHKGIKQLVKLNTIITFENNLVFKRDSVFPWYGELNIFSIKHLLRACPFGVDPGEYGWRLANFTYKLNTRLTETYSQRYGEGGIGWAPTRALRQLHFKLYVFNEIRKNYKVYLQQNNMILPDNNFNVEIHKSDEFGIAFIPETLTLEIFYKETYEMDDQINEFNGSIHLQDVLKNTTLVSIYQEKYNLQSTSKQRYLHKPHLGFNNSSDVIQHLKNKYPEIDCEEAVYGSYFVDYFFGTSQLILTNGSSLREYLRFSKGALYYDVDNTGDLIFVDSNNCREEELTV